MLQLQRFSAAPPSYLYPMLQRLGLTPRHAKLLWKAMCDATDPRTTALRYELDTFRQKFFVQNDEKLRFFVNTIWSTSRVIDMIERLVDEQLLTRHDGTRIEDCMFAWMRQGEWR